MARLSLDVAVLGAGMWYKFATMQALPCIVAMRNGAGDARLRLH